jgi:hypothetical protein
MFGLYGEQKSAKYFEIIFVPPFSALIVAFGAQRLR